MFQLPRQAHRKFLTTSLTLICILASVTLFQEWQPRKLAAILPQSNPLATPTPPTPLLDLTVPGMEFPNMTLIGEKFCYTARLSNLIGAPVGYGPCVQIILPDGMVVENAGLPGGCNTGNSTETSFYQIVATTPLAV